MSDTLITVISIALAAVLMFIFPVMTMSKRMNTVSQADISTYTSDFVDEVRTTGKLTEQRYSQFVETITSTGNTYDVELEFKILDENPGKKSTQAMRDKIGENVYYSVFTTQILEEIEKNGVYNLKEGDMISATVKNTNLTLGQQLKDFIYVVTGDDTYSIAASKGGLVTTTAVANN